MHLKRSCPGLHAAIGVIALLAVFSVAPASASVPDGSYHPTLYLGPIPGWTTAWHPAPAATSIPPLAALELKVEVPPGASVHWIGALETARAAGWSHAACPLLEPGLHVIEAEIVTSDGHVYPARVELDVEAVDPTAIRVTRLTSAVAPIVLDETHLNASTYEYFRQHSIAALHEVGPTRYRTFVGRLLTLAAEVSPSGFAPLIEWRIAREGGVFEARLGAATELWFVEPGSYPAWVSAGGDLRKLEFEIYRTRITSHQAGIDAVPDGRAVTFTAETDPRGFESEIEWLASTSFGTMNPVRGQGASFTVRFDGSFSPDRFQ